MVCIHVCITVCVHTYLMLCIYTYVYMFHCCSVTPLCLTLCDTMDYSTPGFSVLHYLSEFAQTHVY